MGFVLAAFTQLKRDIFKYGWRGQRPAVHSHYQFRRDINKEKAIVNKDINKE
jgi:hypothetical protein